MKIDGSGWSKLIEPRTLNLRRSYRYGAWVPCQATTSSGERERAGVEGAAGLLHQFELARHVLVGGLRIVEIARVGEAVGADRAEVRQVEGRAVILAQIAARRAVRQVDGDLDAARDHGEVAGREVERAAFGAQADVAGLRQQHHLGVGVAEIAPLHRGVGAVQVDRQAGPGAHVAVPDIARHAVEEVGGRLGHRLRRPAALGMRKGAVRRRRGQPERQVDPAPVALGQDRRRDAVEPCAPVLRPRRGEGGAADLLGIEAVGRPLGRVAALRQGAGQGLRRVFVAEAGHRAGRCGGGAAGRGCRPVGGGELVHGAISEAGGSPDRSRFCGGFGVAYRAGMRARAIPVPGSVSV